MKSLVASLLALTACSSLLVLATVSAAPAGQGARTPFIGTITDDMCERADHSRMQMGPTDADCTRACVAQHGAAYVLFDGKNVYKLSDQRAPDKFAGQKVRVTGTLDAKTKTIQVTSIVAAK